VIHRARSSAWGRLASIGAVSLALAATLVMNAGLFSFLPLMGYWNARHRLGLEAKSQEMRLTAIPVMPRKKDKPRAQESRKTATPKSVEPGKSIARQRFVMDLGAGGGSSGGASAKGLAGKNMEQVEYSEGETDEDARPLAQTAPKKPKKAESAGAGGLVRCLLTVGEDGRVTDIRFLEVPPGDFGFEEAVREAVREWRYQPAKVSGVAVRQKIEQPFKF
jgi:periplasmic protein TonB